MALMTINCATCGAPRKTRQPHTKYCVVCALVRDLMYVAQNAITATCLLCERDFLPLKRGERLCGKCYEVVASDSTRGECVLCGRERKLLRDEIRACHRCARAPKHRADLIRKLVKKQEILSRQEHPDGAELDRQAEEERRRQAEAEERAMLESPVPPI